MNSSSKVSSSISSSSSSSIGSLNSWTRGVSNGGVSVNSKSSARAALASLTFCVPQWNRDFNFANTVDTGVAVITKIAKKRIIKRIGIVKIVVRRATKGVATAYPIHPPPWRIALWPVPIDPLKICIKPANERIRSAIPTVIRAVDFPSSGDLKSLKAK